MNKLKVVIDGIEKVAGKDIVVYDMRNISPFYDYMVVSSVSNNRSVGASVKHIKDNLEEINEEFGRVEGLEDMKWVLIDLNNIIVNIFLEDEREYYNIDKLWTDVPILDLDRI